MKLNYIDTSAIDSAITRSERHLPEVQNLLEEFKRLNIGNLTETVFKAIISCNIDELRPAWDKRVNEDIANITQNPQIAARFRADADQPFLEFVAKVQKVKRDRESPSIGGLALDAFYSIEKGKVLVNKEAIKEHFTSYASDFGQLLFEKAQNAKKALDELIALLKENDFDPKLYPVITDEIPVIFAGFVKPAKDAIFYQRDGEIKMNEDLFYNV